jgi:hypothetical protein
MQVPSELLRDITKGMRNPTSHPESDSTYIVRDSSMYWMDATSGTTENWRRAARIPHHKLSDEFAQYTLVLKCSYCGHERTADPQILGRLYGWDSRLEDVAKQMRCPKCGKKQCTPRPCTRKRYSPAMALKDAVNMELLSNLEAHVSGPSFGLPTESYAPSYSIVACALPDSGV